jgi:amino acid transporter
MTADQKLAATAPSPELGSSKPPELERVMGPFASFAISMSTICIVAGGLASFHVAFCSVGGASIGLGWPLGCLFGLIMALTMGQVASAFPRSGGPYQWASILGSRGWGWVTAWFGLAGLITVLAAVNVGTCRFVIGAMSRIGAYKPEEVYPAVQALVVVLMTLSQALINHRGMRLTAKVVDLNGYLVIAVAVVLTGAMLIFGVFMGPGIEPGRLITFTNYSGLPAGDQAVWPSTDNVLWLFALGILLPAYTITGYDAAAQTAEETIDPRRNVPRAIVQAVLISGLAGWVMLSAIVLAIPDMGEAARAGDQSFFYIIRAVVPQPLRTTLYIGMIAAMYLCGLSTLTATSRMVFAFARDGGLPFSAALRRIGTHRTPSIAIWAVAGVASLFAVSISYEAIASVSVIFLDIAYVLPTLIGLFVYGRSWTQMGPWHVGAWYRPLAAASVLGCVAIIIIGVQPPNTIAAWVVGATVVLLVGLWFGHMRRHFPGPPEEVLQQVHQVETADK